MVSQSPILVDRVAICCRSIYDTFMVSTLAGLSLEATGTLSPYGAIMAFCDLPSLGEGHVGQELVAHRSGVVLPSNSSVALPLLTMDIIYL